MCRRAWVQVAAEVLSGNSLGQTVHTHRASVHQSAKLVAALLRVVRVTAGLVESNGSLPPGLWLTPPAGWLPRTRISSGTLQSILATFTFLLAWCVLLWCVWVSHACIVSWWPNISLPKQCCTIVHKLWSFDAKIWLKFEQGYPNNGTVGLSENGTRERCRKSTLPCEI